MTIYLQIGNQKMNGRHPRFLITVAIAIFLAGCTGDPFAGLMGSSPGALEGLRKPPGPDPALNAPVSVPAGAVALVPSRNMEAFLAKGPDVGQNDLVIGATAILRTRFPSLTLVDNLALAKARGVELTVVLDVQGAPETPVIKVVALDRAQNPVSRLEVAVSDTGASTRDNYDIALSSLDHQVKEVFR